jgi:ribosomal protein L28
MRHCAKCGKGSKMVGHRKLLRGHYNPTNWSRKYPNLQKKRMPDGLRSLICTGCIKTLSKTIKPKSVKPKKAKTAVA